MDLVKCVPEHHFIDLWYIQDINSEEDIFVNNKVLRIHKQKDHKDVKRKTSSFALRESMLD